MVFDLYGTLVDIHTDEKSKELWKKMARLYREYGAAYQPRAMQKEFEERIREKQRCADEIQIEEVFAELFFRKQVQIEGEELLDICKKFREYSTEYIRLYPGVHGLLAGLRGQGRKIYLLSNAQRVFTAHELSGLDIGKYFDGILLSSDYGVKKPNLRFFEALFVEYGLEPEECLMIGNDETCDIGGGNRASMGTLYLHTNLSPEYRGRQAADRAVMSGFSSCQAYLSDRPVDGHLGIEILLAVIEEMEREMV